jgi:hypothetical protein
MQKHKYRVLTEEKLGDWGVQSSARRATKLVKPRPYKTRVIHALQLCNPAITVHFCNLFLQSVVKGEIGLQLTFLSD